MIKTRNAKIAANSDGSDTYTKSTPEQFKSAILWHLQRSLARAQADATNRDWWLATALAVRDDIMGRFISTMRRQHSKDVRRIYYLSLEYLMGRLTEDMLTNAGLTDVAKEAIKMLGLDYNTLMCAEVDMGLGNGGLGRLAACFQDSLASLDYPAVGYGILYEFGLFTQSFENGHQVESPDNWLRYGSPWDIVRPEYTVKVPLGGRVEGVMSSKGDWTPHWVPQAELLGVPWDVPIVGYNANTVNFLRLWESRSTNDLDLNAFNEGGYTQAVHQKAMSETISKVLYPNDKTENGKALRLAQQYFFVTCSLQDIIRRFKKNGKKTWDQFPDKVCIQLNDTHPAIAIPELMRLLLDVEGLDWDSAWGICTKVFAYTNHTLLPEALEKWAVSLFEKVLPRHLQIIYEINHRWLAHVESVYGKDLTKLEHLSIVEEGPVKMLRMAYLSVVGSFSVNGVAALHTELLKDSVLRDFYQISPEKFNNKTNGITPRRWLKTSNPELSKLISKTLKNEDWPKDLQLLRGLEKFADDAKFQKEYMSIKRNNKVKLAEIVKKLCNVELDPDSIFDVQIKRLHEYKRQHLNLLHILALYRKLLHNPDADIPARSFIFGAKAAPGYDLAKNIIWAINTIGNVINNDTRIKGKLKVVFIPNYNVSLAMDIIPAADVSEQISTAGKEASGTGNMKLALNGAITMGTLDGANVEILEEAGQDNVFIFGLNVDDVQKLKAEGYNPWNWYNSDEELKAVLDWLVSDCFIPENPDAFMPLRKSILDWGDPYMLCADFRSYCEAQARLGEAYKDKKRWAKMAILNTARMAKFSSDRTIHEYAKDIWKLAPVPPEGK